MNEIPKRFMNNIKTTPLSVNLSRKHSKPHYDDLVATLKVIKSTESVQLSLQEAIGLFGKGFKLNVAGTLRNRGIKRPKCVERDGIVYITSCEV